MPAFLHHLGLGNIRHRQRQTAHVEGHAPPLGLPLRGEQKGDIDDERHQLDTKKAVPRLAGIAELAKLEQCFFRRFFHEAASFVLMHHTKKSGKDDPRRSYTKWN